MRYGPPVPVVAFALLAASALIAPTAAWTARGCVDLDSSTFDLVTRKFRYSLVKFDTAFPYGDKHEAFTGLALETVGTTDELLFALVGIKDYGEQDNADLGRRFAIPKEYPVIKLFHGDGTPPIDFAPADGEVTGDSLRKFLKRHTALYIGLPGCTERLDRLAQSFVDTVEPAEWRDLIEQVERAERAEPDAASRAPYPMYLSLMRKIVKEADGGRRTTVEVVADEMKRVEKLLAGKLSDAKRAELKLRLNVMLSFGGASSGTRKPERAEL
uniref:Endoplasmic reticulum resident protein 29 n=1 Tax=Anopheles coluzzii TaxID=1518534 RepID=A0A6E8V8L0_ANOCL|nr:protein windbeutel [Anopheles coluzzii]